MCFGCCLGVWFALFFIVPDLSFWSRCLTMTILAQPNDCHSCNDARSIVQFFFDFFKPLSRRILFETVQILEPFWFSFLGREHCQENDFLPLARLPCSASLARKNALCGWVQMKQILARRLWGTLSRRSGDLLYIRRVHSSSAWADLQHFDSASIHWHKKEWEVTVSVRRTDKSWELRRVGFTFSPVTWVPLFLFYGVLLGLCWPCCMFLVKFGWWMTSFGDYCFTRHAVGLGWIVSPDLMLSFSCF